MVWVCICWGGGPNGINRLRYHNEELESIVWLVDVTMGQNNAQHTRLKSLINVLVEESTDVMD